MQHTDAESQRLQQQQCVQAGSPNTLQNKSYSEDPGLQHKHCQYDICKLVGRVINLRVQTCRLYKFDKSHTILKHCHPTPV
jgi:hypothetical protein